MGHSGRLELEQELYSRIRMFVRQSFKHLTDITKVPRAHTRRPVPRSPIAQPPAPRSAAPPVLCLNLSCTIFGVDRALVTVPSDTDSEYAHSVSDAPHPLHTRLNSAISGHHSR